MIQQLMDIFMLISSFSKKSLRIGIFLYGMISVTQSDILEKLMIILYIKLS